MNNVFEKFTLHGKAAIKNAFILAQSQNLEKVEPEHILYGISQEKGSIGSEILSRSSLKPDIIKNTISPGEVREKSKKLFLSDLSRRLIEKATVIANYNNHKYIGTEHLLSALLNIETDGLKKIFQKAKTDPLQLKDRLNLVLKSTSKFPDLGGAMELFKSHDEEYSPWEPRPTRVMPSALDYYATNLTDAKIQTNIDPVIGREKEITRLIQILSRRTKNNPLLLGDPGVGKTAIVEGLAKKIINGEVPDVLLDKKIYSLDLGLVVAGSSFRGEFENRLKQIIMEVKQNPSIILFIDEIHNIIGAGSATGSMDAANILKPSLARGEIRCIGATTMEEYKKYIENDLALERRFQSIIVNQPTVEKTIEILKGIRANYENYHGVSIADEAISFAATFSHRYIQEKFLPDKAIDIIDEAASAFKIIKTTDGLLKKIKILERESLDLNEQKKSAVTRDDFDSALKIRQKEEVLKLKIAKLKEKNAKNHQDRLGIIGKNEVMEIISNITGVPLSNILSEEKNQLISLEKNIAKKIIGQDEAVKAVSEFIIRSRAGISDSRRPIGSFIFLGPSGVGKTELAKVLAQTVFGGPDSLIRLDMSEFSESFNISKLIGSPAGYVGYKDSVKLIDQVRKKPYSVVLFDEIEKAHRQIFNLLLQILEDGQLTDAAGKTINFRNTIIVMTSNVGSELFNDQAAIGFQSKKKNEPEDNCRQFDEAKKEVLKKLNNVFNNEFLNRVDKIITFNPLNSSSIFKIAKIQIENLAQRLAEKNIICSYDESAVSHLARLSYSPKEGARLIRKNILEHLETPLAKKIIESDSQGNFKISVAGKKIAIE